MMEESTTEHLRREVQKFIDAGHPYGEEGDEIVRWFAWYPAKVREAIFLIIDGHHSQDHRAHLKGAQTARARRKGAA